MGTQIVANKLEGAVLGGEAAIKQGAAFGGEAAKKHDSFDVKHYNDATMEDFDNPSGIKALEYNVLVRPDTVDNKHKFQDPETGREFTIHKPDDLVDKEQVAATTATVVDVSKTAFNFEDGADFVRPGDRVVFARYAGMKVTGLDGHEYLMLKDKDVAGRYAE